MKKIFILTINPGSTSTKIAVYENETEVFTETLYHLTEDLQSFKTIAEQFEFRKNAILETLDKQKFDLNTLNVIVGRGGLLYPVESGIYEVNQQMITDLTEAKNGSHASNLGGLIANKLAESIGKDVKAYIADPVVVDEMCSLARYTGHPLFKRLSIFHALNQKAIARTYAKKIGKPYEQLNLIVAHMGGGISIGVHQRGRVIDVNNALDGEGPYSPERSGTLPVGGVIQACFSGKYTIEEMKKMVNGKGGVVAYLGSNDLRACLAKYNEGDTLAIEVLSAMCYNIAKMIGAMATTLNGDIDAILLTGGIANDKKILMPLITERVKFIAPVEIFPGEDEMLALAQNGLMVAKGEIAPKLYYGVSRA